MTPGGGRASLRGGFGGIGLLTNWWSVRYTTRSSQQTARDQRLWEKRSAVYEDVINAALKQRDTQLHRQRGVRYDKETERMLDERLKAWEALDQAAFMPRMFIYASDESLAAARRVDDAAEMVAA